MLKLEDFRKLTKSQVLNERYLVGGANATETRGGDDWKHDNGHVIASGPVPRGGNAEADCDSPTCGPRID